MKRENLQGFKSILYIGLPLLVFVILYDICAALLQYVSLLVAGQFTENGLAYLDTHSGSYRALCIMGGLILAFLCLFKLALTDGFLAPKKKTWKQPMWFYLVLGLGTAAFAYLCNYLFTKTGFVDLSSSYNQVAQNQFDVAPVIGILLYGIVSPFVEEVVFRGFVYGRMKVYMQKYVAIFVSSLLFGIYHSNIVQGVYGFVMGVFFALVYEKYKNFYFAVFLHQISNLVAFYISLNGFFF